MARVGNSDADGVQPEKAKRPRGKRGGAETRQRGRRVEERRNGDSGVVVKRGEVIRG